MLTYKRILVMLAVDILGDNSYGSNVRNLIINTTGKYHSMHGGIYVYLHRLEELGYLQAWVGKLAPRKFYSLTTLGLKKLTEVLDELEEFTKTSRIVLRKKGQRCTPSLSPSGKAVLRLVPDSVSLPSPSGSSISQQKRA